MLLWALLLLAEPPAELIITNAKVWTAVPSHAWTEAVAIRDGQIVKTGSNAEIRELTGPETDRIDAKGRMVMPGFNDAHVHFLQGSIRLNQIDLTGVCTIPQIHTRIKTWLAANPGAAWVTGGGWEYTCFPGNRLPTRQDLDIAVPDRPAFLRAYDGHTYWANSKALEVAGITMDTKFSGFGEIVLDPASGEPTGVFKEGAGRLVAKHLPPATRAEKIAAIENGLRLAASLGITSIQNASGDREELELYEDLLRQGKLTVRTNLAISMTSGCDTLADLKGRHTGPMLKVSAVKFVLDGVIETRTAAMLKPYADAPDTSGKLARLPDEYKEAVKECQAAGWQVYTHAIGDLAVRTALEAYSPLPRGSRPRIEHIELIDSSDLDGFVRTSAIASMMPIHADPGTIDVWIKAVGPARLNNSFPWGGLKQAGARLVFSSDWPSSISLDPWRGVHSAVNRRTLAGDPTAGWLPQHRVSLSDALQAYTHGAAFAEFEEARKGQIRPGQVADLIVLSQNPFDISAIEIGRTRVDITIFNGKVIYTRQRSSKGP